MANLIVCCDGTWNTPDQREDGLPAATNVVKMHRAIAPEDSEGTPQGNYYHPGVGTDGGRLARLAGGGLGRGLDDNVKSAYHWLAGHYRDGDRIFLFGFSRGAYTVRSVAGMIGRCGLLDLTSGAVEAQAGRDTVDEVFDAYRAWSGCMATRDMRFHQAGMGENPGGRVPVHFLGVWDTVGSLGIPDYLGFLKLFDQDRHEFHDTVLGDTVRHARHAVAIDEMRESFLPTLWSNAPAHADAKQMWFPGVHGDVGGGYAQSELSDGALLWMMTEAQEHGLALRPHMLEQIAENAEGAMHDSLTGMFREFPTRPRPVPEFGNPDSESHFHATSIGRHRKPGLAYGEYWKSRALDAGQTVEFDVYAAEPWNFTGLYLREGQRYRFRASGRWVDRNTVCGPLGTPAGGFDPDDVARSISSFLSWGEEMIRIFSDHDTAELRLTRRRDDLPWFCLCGALANGGIAGGGDRARPHESFYIGDGIDHIPRADGYLYCFANDAWSFYENNRGSVRVTIEEA